MFQYVSDDLEEHGAVHDHTCLSCAFYLSGMSFDSLLVFDCTLHLLAEIQSLDSEPHRYTLLDRIVQRFFKCLQRRLHVAVLCSLLLLATAHM